MRPIFRDSESAALLATREGSLLSALDLVLERRRWNREQVRAFQTCTLQALVTYAYEHVPFYRAKYDAANFHPSPAAGRDDLANIPLVTKDDLRQADLSQLKDPAYPAPARLLSSSGSTGVPSQLFCDDDALLHFTAQDTALYYDWCDRRPLRDTLYFLDLVPGSIDLALADLLRTTVPEERLLLASEPPEVLIGYLKQFSPEFISSYPSTMRNIAITLQRRGATYEKLRLLHLTSEMLDARTRSLLERVFPRAKIVQTYTSSEGGLMAHECAAGRWHLTEENAIYEIVDADGRPTEDLGELVVTNLTNWATPIIRYRGLGDFCRWATTECSCGSDRRSIAQLEGRATESLELADGTLVTPFALTNALEEVAGVYQFQVIQRGSGDLQVLIVRDESAGHGEDQIRVAAQAAIQNVMSAATACEVRCVDRIPNQPGSHKTPLVVSRPSLPGRPA